MTKGCIVAADLGLQSCSKQWPQGNNTVRWANLEATNMKESPMKSNCEERNKRHCFACEEFACEEIGRSCAIDIYDCV